MDAVILELNHDVWRLLYVKSSFKSPRIAARVEFPGTVGERVSAVSGYISSNKLSETALGIVLPRDISISKILEIPAPNINAIKNILNFEIEKHLPLPPAEMYYGHQVLGKKDNNYSVFISASTKKNVEQIIETFAASKLKPTIICSWHEALLNSLFLFKKIDKTGKHIFIKAGREITVDLISGLLPQYSRCVKTDSADPDDLLKILKKEIRGALAYSGGSLEDLNIIFLQNPGKDIISQIEKYTNKKISILDFQVKLDPSDIVAFGGGLALLGSGKVSLNLLSGVELNTLKAANILPMAIFLSIVTLAGGSYVARDTTTIKRLDASISELKGLRDKSKMGAESESAAKIKALESISRESSPQAIDLLRELTEILPDDSWLTSLDLNDNSAVLEGVSGNAPSLLITLEKSRLMHDFEFADPVVRTSKGKEKFRIKCKINVVKGREA